MLASSMDDRPFLRPRLRLVVVLLLALVAASLLTKNGLVRLYQ